MILKNLIDTHAWHNKKHWGKITCSILTYDAPGESSNSESSSEDEVLSGWIESFAKGVTWLKKQFVLKREWF